MITSALLLKLKNEGKKSIFILKNGSALNYAWMLYAMLTKT